MKTNAVHCPHCKTLTGFVVAVLMSFGPQLVVGSVSESVTVSAQGVNVNTASSEGSAMLTTQQLETLSNCSRDVVSLLNLLPGAETRDPVESIGNTSNESSPRVMGLQTQRIQLR